MQRRSRLILGFLAVLCLTPLTAVPAGEKTKYVGPQLWEYRVIQMDLSKVNRELNKLGLEGWELISANLNNRFDERDNPRYILFLKRPLKGPPEKDGLTGVWKLSNPDKHGVTELHMECFLDRSVRVWGKGPGIAGFEFDGQYELGKDQVRFRLSHGREIVETLDKIKKLTPTELTLENDEGKIEGFQRVK